MICIYNFIDKRHLIYKNKHFATALKLQTPRIVIELYIYYISHSTFLIDVLYVAGKYESFCQQLVIKVFLLANFFYRYTKIFFLSCIKKIF